MGATPECPRRGYDQTGLVDTWQTECPLYGRCTECGLKIRWAEVLNTDIVGPAWSYEHATRRSTTRLLLTLGMMYRPRRFWRELRLEHAVRCRRMCNASIFGAMVCHAILFTALLLLLFVTRALDQLSFAWASEEMIAYAAWPYGSARHWPSSVFSANPTPILAIISAAVMPWTFMLLPVTRRLCKVRIRHCFRVAVYSAPVVLIAASAEQLLMGVAQVVENTLWHFGSPMFRTTDWIIENIAVFAIVVPPMVLYWWWRIAIRDYLRMQHARTAAITLTLVAYLTAGLVTTVLFGPMLFWHLE